MNWEFYALSLLSCMEAIWGRDFYSRLKHMSTSPSVPNQCTNSIHILHLEFISRIPTLFYNKWCFIKHCLIDTMWVLTIKLSLDWNGLVKIKKINVRALNKNTKEQNLKRTKAHRDIVKKPSKRKTGCRDSQRAHSTKGPWQRKEWAPLQHQLHKPHNPDSVGDLLAMWHKE